VTKLGTTGTTWASLLPKVLYAIGGRFDNFGWLGATERATAILVNQRPDFFTRQNM
jgi:hypothetical protein